MAHAQPHISGKPRKALRLVSTRDMPRDEWLNIRKRGIGSLDAATAVGLNPYKSQLELWLEKTGRDGGLAKIDPLDESSPTYWGNILEPIVASHYSQRTGHRVRRLNAVLQHPDPQLDWMLANIEREVIGAEDVQILECKTAGINGARLWKDCVPEYVQLQVMHQLAVTGKQAADVAVLLGGQQLEIHRIERDECLIARLIELEQRFWQYVVNDTPPPADGSESADQALRCLYPQDNGQQLDFSDDPLLSGTFEQLQQVPGHTTANGRGVASSFFCACRPSMIPPLTSHRLPIQLIADQPPGRHVAVEDRQESAVVAGFDQVGEFVQQDVLQALQWFLRQFQIQPDAPGVGVAAAPQGLHALDAPVFGLHTQHLLPFVQQGWHALFHFCPVEGIQQRLALLGCAFGAGAQFQQGLAAQGHSGRTGVGDEAQPAAGAEQIVCFTADHLPLGLAGLLLEATALLADPAQAVDDGHAHRFVVHRQRSRNPHPAFRRVHAQMQVLDVLAHHFDAEACNLQAVTLSRHADSSPAPVPHPAGHRLHRRNTLRHPRRLPCHPAHP